jgi:hypothetical protein
MYSNFILAMRATNCTTPAKVRKLAKCGAFFKKICVFFEKSVLQAIFINYIPPTAGKIVSDNPALLGLKWVQLPFVTNKRVFYAKM